MLRSFAAACLVTIAILAAVYCEGALRAFWLGFAVFGWGFVIFTLYSLETLNWRAPGGTTFIHYLYDEVLPKTYVEGEPPVFTPRWPSRSHLSFISQPQVLVRSVSFHNFFTVFHSLCGILVGYFGGLVADVLFRRREFRRRASEQRGGTTDAE